MAMNWIKMSESLLTNGKVMRLCSILSDVAHDRDICRASGATDARHERDNKKSMDLATMKSVCLGALFQLWSIADAHTIDGFLIGWSAQQMDDQVGVDGFCEALSSPLIGWLDIRDTGLQVIRFTEHNGKSTKRRVLNSRRQERLRAETEDISRGVRRAQSATKARHQRDKSATREEKRREEKRRTPPPPPPSGSSRELSESSNDVASRDGRDVAVEAPEAKIQPKSRKEEEEEEEKVSRQEETQPDAWGFDAIRRDFEALWDAWPKHRRYRKAEAAAAWITACRSCAGVCRVDAAQASADILAASIALLILPKAKKRECPGVATFLQNEMWEDDPVSWGKTAARSVASRSGAAGAIADESRSVRQARESLRDGGDDEWASLDAVEVVLRYATTLHFDAMAINIVRGYGAEANLAGDEVGDLLGDLQKRRRTRATTPKLIGGVA